MACDFGMSACGASDFCTSEHSGASGYGQGSCVSSSPQGQSCTPNAKSTPTGFECVDLSYSSYSQTYGPGGRYLARCSSGSDCPAGTTCLTGGAGGDPLSHCVGPRK
jgi:hypothetical protein